MYNVFVLFSFFLFVFGGHKLRQRDEGKYAEKEMKLSIIFHLRLRV